jgi:hypothetical protein
MRWAQGEPVLLRGFNLDHGTPPCSTTCPSTSEEVLGARDQSNRSSETSRGEALVGWMAYSSVVPMRFTSSPVPLETEFTVTHQDIEIAHAYDHRFYHDFTKRGDYLRQAKLTLSIRDLLRPIVARTRSILKDCRNRETIEHQLD